MKTIKIIFIFLFIFILSSCKKNNTSDDLSIPKTMNVGDTFLLNIDEITRGKTYDRIDLISTNESVARINYKEELIALRTGKSKIRVELHKGENMTHSHDFGTIFVIDFNDPIFTPISNLSDLKNKINKKPGGFYFLAQDIDCLNNFTPIPYFEGILLNPYSYRIKNLNINNFYNNKTNALFEETYEAYIDGLIFEDVNINGLYLDTNQSEFTGTLVGLARGSYIANINVTGEVSHGYHIGGIIGYLDNSILEKSSFKGMITGGERIGGLVGQLQEDNLVNNPHPPKTKVIDCFVIANISSGEIDLDMERRNRIGGLVGILNGGAIISSYYCGTITDTYNDITSPIVNIEFPDYPYYLVDLYSTIEISNEDSLKSDKCGEYRVFYITEDRLKSGESLDGLDAFIFYKNQFPQILRYQLLKIGL